MSKLRVCTPGDYRPFSLLRADGAYEGIDIDLVQAVAKSLGVEAEIVKSSWPTLMKDFQDKCDVVVGGISVTLERQKAAFFTTAYMVNGKAPITKCENVAKYQTVADIDRPGVTVIENPGGSNERFARATFKQAKIVIFNDNATIFDEILGFISPRPMASTTAWLAGFDNPSTHNSGERMFDHVKFGVSNYEASKAFYLQALEPLGVAVVSEGPPAYGVELSTPEGKSSLCLFQTQEEPAHLHVAFVAESRQQVDAFHRAALQAGGKDHGAPGLRPNYHANYYAAFVIDPDGHNIEAVCHKREA